jgi:CelD/BcsL family acetyltransferase involved in cellulose biosynthesis
LAAPGRSNEVSKQIAQWLNGEQNTVADLLQLDGIDVTCSVFTSFEDTARESNYTLVDTSSIHTWRLSLPATMDEYVASLSKSCRRKVRTALKRFASGELTVSIANDANSFEKNWGHFVDLHQLRRASLGDRGCFADQTFAGFLYDIASQFLAAEKLDMVCVFMGDKAIATEICFRGRDCSYAYQIGNDPGSLKENPGWLVNTASIRRAINLGLGGFDFCRGDFEYKRQLGAKPHVCRRLRMTPPRIRSQVLNAAITGGTAVRNWCQSTLHFPTTP